MSDPDHKITLAASRDMTHPLVRLAMSQGGAVDPATLRELLTLQREWEAGEAKRAYTAALVDLKRDMPRVLARDATVDFTNRSGVRTHYRHTSLAAALDEVSDHLTAHGFALTWEPQTAGQSVSVTCRLTHRDGHSESTTITAPVDTSGSKSPAQGVASTITLLSRYTALALLGIATRDHSEPQGHEAVPGEDGTIDTARNLRACGEITRRGRTRAEAETHVGRDMECWTAGDREALRDWLRAKPAGAVNEPGTSG